METREAVDIVGGLSGELLDSMNLTSVMREIRDSGIVFDAIAGIADKENLIMSVLYRLMELSDFYSQGDFRVVELKKPEVGGEIEPVPHFELRKGERLLLMHNSIHWPGLIPAIVRVVEKSGGVVIGVIVPTVYGGMRFHREITMFPD